MKKKIFLVLLLFWSVSAFARMDYATIDKYACDAPPLVNSNRLGALVRYLVKPFKSDEEKARVLLAWIVCHVDYDEYKATSIEKNKDPSVKKKQGVVPYSDILETRLGVCEDIAKLYQKMGKMAGLKVELISGNAGKDKTVFDLEYGAGHMWNAVKIEGEWEYVDPTWAMEGADTTALADLEKHKDYQKELKKRKRDKKDIKMPREGRSVDNQWFLTDKEEMIKTHFPDDKKWQLQKKKISKAEFLGLTERAYKSEKRQSALEYKKKKRSAK